MVSRTVVRSPAQLQVELVKLVEHGPPGFFDGEMHDLGHKQGGIIHLRFLSAPGVGDVCEHRSSRRVVRVQLLLLMHETVWGHRAQVISGMLHRHVDRMGGNAHIAVGLDRGADLVDFLFVRRRIAHQHEFAARPACSI